MGIEQRKIREKEIRREGIIDAAEEIFLSSGFSNTTMEQIAEKAELGKGTLYLHFKSKEELLLAVYLKNLEQVERIFLEAMEQQETGIDKIRVLSRMTIEAMGSFRKYAVLNRYIVAFATEFDRESPILSELLKKRDEMFESIVEAIKLGIDDGTIKSDVPPATTALLLLMMLKGVAWTAVSREELIRQHYGVEAVDIVESAMGLIEDSLLYSHDNKMS